MKTPWSTGSSCSVRLRVWVYWSWSVKEFSRKCSRYWPLFATTLNIYHIPGIIIIVHLYELNSQNNWHRHNYLHFTDEETKTLFYKEGPMEKEDNLGQRRKNIHFSQSEKIFTFLRVILLVCSKQPELTGSWLCTVGGKKQNWITPC